MTTTTVSSRFADAEAKFTALIDALTEESWSAPSPCDGWTARDIVEHVATSEADFLAQRRLPVAGTVEIDAVEAWPTIRDAIQAALDEPSQATSPFDGYFGPTTVEETIDRFYTPDLLVHRWDLATAVGLPEHAVLNDEEVDYLTRSVGSYPAEVMRMPGLFGPELVPPADADSTTRLMAYLGRS